MNRGEILHSIILSTYTLTRIAAQEVGNDAPAAQWRVLNLLEADGSQRVGELAKASRTTQPGITRLVGQLEQEGLVQRSADPEDSRATIVTITESGRNALHAWREDLQRSLAPRFNDLDDTDWQHLSRAAEILHTHSRLERKTR